MTTPAGAGFWEAPRRAAMLLGLGFLVGPSGLDVLQSSVLTLLGPIVPVALATLGVMAVLARPRRLSELIPVAVAAVAVFAIARDVTGVQTLLVRGEQALVTSGPAALVGVSGLTMLSRAASLTERRVMVLALLLVLGGVADFAAVPAVPLGVVAGVIMLLIPSAARDPVTRDLEYLSRPLAACLLVVMGAQVTVSDTVLVIAAIQMAVALAASRVSWLGGGLPGLLALCVAIDAARGLYAGFAVLADATIVAVGTLHLAALLLVDRETPSAVAPALPTR